MTKNFLFDFQSDKKKGEKSCSKYLHRKKTCHTFALAKANKRRAKWVSPCDDQLLLNPPGLDRSKGRRSSGAI